METKSKTKGLAPFASVEDLSDEQDSPGHEKHRLALPGIKEDTGLKSPRSGPAAITPRIDISRASSSSHHDDSSPERDIFAGPGVAPGGAKLGLGFSEEMALELRSSTEELDFQDPADTEIKMKRKKLHQQHAVTKCDLDTQGEKDTKERKDSACSDIGLLSISGRTSRLSSIGSAASGGSGASRISGNSHLSSGSHLSGLSHMSGVSGASHLSGVSHISGVSHVSGVSHISGVSNLSQLSKASRCSSPHRMLLETSFCGQKPIPTVSLEAEYPPEECVEAALLARKSDPTGAVLPPEGTKPFVNGNRRLSSSTSTLTVKRTSSRIEHKSKSSSDGLSRTHSGKSTSSVPVPSRTKRHSSAHKVKLNEFEQIISLHGDDDVEDEKESGTKTDQRLSPENGIYIPLKGPDIIYTKSTKHDNIKFDNQVKSKTSKSRTKTNQVKHGKDEEMVKFISLHADESKRKPIPVQTNQDEACLLTKKDLKSEKLNQADVQSNVPTIQAEYFKPDELISDPSYVRKHSAGSCRSPEFEIAKVKPATLDLTGVVRPSRQSLTQLPKDESRTPSPAASLYKGSVFRRSSDSSSSSKSRISGVSGSSESKSRKDSRNKSSFTNLFKKGSKERTSGRKRSETAEKNSAESRPKNIEITYNHEDKIQDGDCIVIPLHSPDSVGEPVLLVADMEPDNLIEVHLVKTPSKSLSLKSQDLTPASVIEVAALTAQCVDPVGDVKLNTQTESNEEDKIAASLKEETEAEVLPVEVNLKAEVDVQTKLEVDVKEKSDISVNNTKSELADLLGSDKKLDPEKKAGSEERRSSGSEPDSDAVPLPNGEDDEHERKGLVHQAESVEDELPYVPTTLPQERSVAHPIVPIKQRVSEVKTCPIDRPRSTTPINPATLDDYVSSPHEEVATPKDKMQIILPRAGSVTKESRSKSPGKVKPWTHFAEQGLQSPRRTASPSPPTVTPPPLPPRVSTTWVCFDELPERRRTPKRITTLPAPPNPQTTAGNIVYNYVNPDECSCECHETQGRVNGAQCSDRAGQCSATDKDKSSYRT